MSILLIGIIGTVQMMLLGYYFLCGLKYKSIVKDKKTIGEELVKLVNK